MVRAERENGGGARRWEPRDGHIYGQPQAHREAERQPRRHAHGHV